MTSPFSRPQLQTLDGRPLTWVELHRMNAEWWAAQEPEERGFYRARAMAITPRGRAWLSGQKVSA